MLLIKCPYCGEEHPENEFAYAGQAHIVRPENPDALDDAAWQAFLFQRDNIRGVQYERWRHSHGCARFFNAVRDTVSDRFLATYRAGAPKPDLSDLERPAAGGAPDTTSGTSGRGAD